MGGKKALTAARRRGRKPKLNREDCDDIRRMYADRTRNVQTMNLAHLFHVTTATIHRVLNGRYVPIEDFEDSGVTRENEF